MIYGICVKGKWESKWYGELICFRIAKGWVHAIHLGFKHVCHLCVTWIEPYLFLFFFFSWKNPLVLPWKRNAFLNFWSCPWHSLSFLSVPKCILGSSVLHSASMRTQKYQKLNFVCDWVASISRSSEEHESTLSVIGRLCHWKAIVVFKNWIN